MPTESETQPQTSEKLIVGGLFTPEEREVCEIITAEKAPWGQRARALLALDEGASETTAAVRSGLRTTQVKYWLGAFHRKRIDIFPENLLKHIEFDSDVPNAEPPEEDVPAAESSAKTKKSKKKKKSKETKKSKGKKGKGSKKKKRKKSQGKKRKKKAKKEKKKSN